MQIPKLNILHSGLQVRTFGFIPLTWFFLGHNRHYGRHVLNGNQFHRVLQQAPDSGNGLDHRWLAITFDINPPLGLGRNRSNDTQGSTLPGKCHTLVHDLQDEFLFLSRAARDHPEAGIGNRGDQGLLGDRIGGLHTAGPIVEDRSPSEASGLFGGLWNGLAASVGGGSRHSVPILDVLGYFLGRSFLNEPSPGLGTTTILLFHQLDGIVVHLFLSDVFLGIVLSDHIVRVVVASVGLLL